MKPFFPYYGSKWRLARRYGPPAHDLVIEPFAGSAGYATYWEPRRALLIDRDSNIVQVWQYLLRVTADEVLRLPDLRPGESVDDLRVAPEAKLLIGFWVNRGSAQPKKRITAFSSRAAEGQLVWSARARERIAAQIEGVRGWTVRLGDYREAPNQQATWFIDPPYVEKGRFYRCKFSDYATLGAWARSQSGRVVVCEGVGANWLPFAPLGETKSTKGTAPEFVWIREAA